MREHNQTENKLERKETLFERWCREERRKKIGQNDALFFGFAVLLAFYAMQNVFTIQ